MLTKKQYQLLIFIDSRLKEVGISPSFEEMKSALKLKSKSGIHRLISGLEERGFIRRLPHRARALEVIKLPQNTAPSQTNVIQHASFGQEINSVNSHTKLTDVIELPLYGKIAAGTPVEALRDPSQNITIPSYLLGPGEHYTLEIEGDSMIDSGINDGDTVIIQRCNTVDSGSIVVALVDKTEVTLKRFRKKGASIALEPANKNYETRIFGPDRVGVQGRLVGLLRKY